MQGKTTSLLIDSGAKITIISKEFYVKKNKHKVKIYPPDITPDAYGGEPIELLGYFCSPLEYKNRIINAKVYISQKGDSILNWFHQRSWCDPRS